MSAVAGRLVPPFYWLSSYLVRAILLLLARWRVMGKERVPKRGPLLVVANHLHFTDPPILIGSLPRRVTFMAKDELFRSWYHWVMRGVGAFPVSRDRLDRPALRRAQAILKRGMAVGIFPEGGRSKSPGLQPALPGAAFLAAHCAVPILPVALWGTDKLRGFSWVFRRPEIRIAIGQPFTLPPINGRLSKEELNRFTTLIMKRICQLLPVSYQGVYRDEG